MTDTAGFDTSARWTMPAAEVETGENGGHRIS